MAEVCSDCIFNTGLNSAETLVNELPHNDREKSLGLIAIIKKALELNAEQVECPGNQITQLGDLHCPLREMVDYTRHLTAGAIPNQNYAVSLDQVRGNNGSTTTGQYL